MRWITVLFGRTPEHKNVVDQEAFDQKIREYDDKFDQLRQAIDEVKRSDEEEAT